MAKPVCVLVLDDEGNILSSLKRVFFEEPFDVVTTAHPFEAMQLIAEKKIKVVITDQRMPMVSGIQFLKEVRENFPDTIRILLTGYADNQVAQEAVSVGQVYRFFTKPWDPQEMRNAVRQGIQLYDMVAENRAALEEEERRGKEL
jgi:two-component system, probable response regulator PhcQ